MPVNFIFSMFVESKQKKKKTHLECGQLDSLSKSKKYN